MNQKIKLLIIGGVAGGASCAARARRLSEDAEITIIEKGPNVSFANCGMPYYIEEVISDREKLLVQTPASLGRNLNIIVRVNTEAVEINKDKKTVTAKNTKTGAQEVLAYDKLVISPGAEAVLPPIPGVKNKNIFVLRSLSDMDAIKESASRQTCKTAVVIGGGYIGLEVTEALKTLGKEVYLVEGTPQVMAPLDYEMAAQIHEHLKQKKIKLLLNTTVTSIEDKSGKAAAFLSSGEEILADIIIVAVGVRPDIKLAKEAGLKIGERGGIAVDESMRTSGPDIYAVGDAVEVDDFVGNFKTLIPLAGPANRQGRIAADNIFGIKSTYKKTQGTGICKVFNLTAAMTGLNEKTCKKINAKYQKIFIHPVSHASYYPGAQAISLKLLFNPENGKILGAQAIGREGVDKRIDVLSVALRHGLTVFDLCDMELCYAPPYGSAKDPVNYAGFVASNYINGLVDIFHTEDIKNDGSQFLLDVREKSEFDAGTIPGAVNIPHYELRTKPGNLPKDKDILVFCRSGVRAYLACRVLKQKGFKCKNLSGGYMTYKYSVDREEKKTDFQEETSDDAGSVCANSGNGNTAAPAGTIKAL